MRQRTLSCFICFQRLCRFRCHGGCLSYFQVDSDCSTRDAPHGSFKFLPLQEHLVHLGSRERNLGWSLDDFGVPHCIGDVREFGFL